MQDANRAGILPVIVKLRRIVKNQDGGIRGGKSFARRLKVPGQNVRFSDALIRQKTIGSLGVCPILANQGNALAGAFGELLEEFSESLVESEVSERAAGDLAIDPGLGSGGGSVINPWGVL